MEHSLSKGRGEHHSLKLPAKATIYYSLSSALAKSVGILTTPIFTRLLTGEEYGKYTLYMSLLGLFTLICSSITSPAVIYRGLEKYNDKKDAFVFSSFILGIGFTAAFCTLLFAFSPFLGLSAGVVLLLSLQLFCDESVGLYQTIRRYEYRYKALSLINALSVILTPLLSIALIYGGGLGYTGRIYGLLIISVCIAVPHINSFIKRGKGSFDKAAVKYIVKRTFPLLPHSASSALGAEIDKLMISAVLGAGALAKYSVAHTVGLGLGFAVSALASALYPWVIRKMSAGKLFEIEPTFSGIIMGLGGASIGVAIFVPEVFHFLAPSEYSAAKFATLPLLISTLPTFASSFVTTGIVNAEKSGYTFYSALATVLSGLLFDLILIPRLEYIGAGLALLFSAVIGLSLNYYFLKKCGISDIFSPKAFATVLLITATGVILSAFSYNFPALRILLLIIPVTMLFRSYEILGDRIIEN